MDKIARIRQEIERQKEINKKLLDGQLKDGCLYALNQVLSFLKTLSEEPDTPEFPETFEICLYDGRTPNKENCNECSTTCSVRKEEPDKSLEEAAEKHASMHPLCNGKPSKASFIAGAEWQKEQDLKEMAQSNSPLSLAYANRCFENGKQAMKEQMLKDAVEGEVHPDDCEIWVNLVGYGYKFNDGDKVRVVVLKEEEE